MTNSFSQPEKPTSAHLKGNLDLKSGEFELALLDLVTTLIPELLTTLRTNKVGNAEDLIINELNAYLGQQGQQSGKKKKENNVDMQKKTLTKVIIE